MHYFTTITIFFLVNIFGSLVLAQETVFECKKVLPLESAEDVLELRRCLKEVRTQIKQKAQEDERQLIFEGSKKLSESKQGPYCIYIKNVNECRGNIIPPNAQMPNQAEETP